MGRSLVGFVTTRALFRRGIIHLDGYRFDSTPVCTLKIKWLFSILPTGPSARHERIL